MLSYSVTLKSIYGVEDVQEFIYNNAKRFPEGVGLTGEFRPPHEGEEAVDANSDGTLRKLYTATADNKLPRLIARTVSIQDIYGSDFSFSPRWRRVAFRLPGRAEQHYAPTTRAELAYPPRIIIERVLPADFVLKLVPTGEGPRPLRHDELGLHSPDFFPPLVIKGPTLDAFFPLRVERS